MIIYDYSNKAVFDINNLQGTIFLILFGVYAFLISSYESRKGFLSKFIYNSKEERILSKKGAKFLGVFVFVMLGINMSFKINDLVYTKNINLFENIETISGRITFVDNSELFGIKHINLTVLNMNFYLIKDSRYLTAKNLIVGDSVKINFFYEEPGYMEVVKIELKK